MSHRVRTLIPYLDYGTMTKQKILPKEKMFTAKTVPSKGGKTPCPTLAKKLGPIQYGILAETVVTILLKNECRLESLDEVAKSIPESMRKFFKIDEWKALAALLKKEFTDLAVKAQVEWTDGDIAGHPDLASDDTVYDIKTTGRFSAMRTQTIFQLLSYYCLAQKRKLPIKKIGVVLPLQLLVIVYDLHAQAWEWRPFYEELNRAIALKENRESGWNTVSQLDVWMFKMMIDEYVGVHCRIDSLSECVEHGITALQFFINGNQTSCVKYTDSFFNATKKLIDDNPQTKIFIHSPYILNLSHPGKGQGTRGDDEECTYRLAECAWGGWTFDCLRKILEFGKLTGIKGVVVHCGKRCTTDYHTCVFTMWCSVIACAQWASPECKLIIETSSGQGGEILCSPSELGSFYLSLPEDTRKNVGICVDTCHVFAAGYDPYKYVMTLTEMGVPIDLFHYNDSAVKCGALKDRHAGIGRGYIGFKPLYDVFQFAMERGIPMVRE